MGFRQVTIKWAVCDYCPWESAKDDTNRDIYLKNYLAHLRREHSPVAKDDIHDIEALFKPFDAYKVTV